MTEEARAPEDRKIAPAEPSAEHLSLRVVSSNGTEVFFKIRRSTRLEKLMAAYCQKMGVANPSSVRFVFDGQRVNPESTPSDLDMEDDDVIDVLLEQTGGRRQKNHSI